ncbi:NAD(P)/FAD-dependent oxidoreductase [Pedobacter hiemivivus]|uniref:NADH:ubiquinone reductase (non-electrogenic) n=1 Tax=Pedobacter hiemivivus TaxID=2530454 RepID=A0A4V2MI48_9SPHI|nr:NAD(P)/FAD-dependent oxidoreductase [Pedobacter hiemivivus]TCC89016.1 NAD(P)/FAD-dependent oxidoreductase [Pedobacter hiemivivus]TKC62579.1 NAD(P)/FAD-dependent oxidoreductase [Pedobacter hiemivivus]
MEQHFPKGSKPRIVIIGGGFGGIELAKKLCSKPVEVIMLDKHNYHTFQPLLYQVATGGLEADSIAFPLRKIFKGHKNLSFRVTEVKKVDAGKNTIETTIGAIEYDYLVLATGSTSNFFGQDEIERNAMPMKSIPEALNLRSLILQNLEAAQIPGNPELKKQLMNFVVVGGGPTGVETAGALAELKKHVLRSDYPDLNINDVNIYLIEGSPELLGNMSVQSQQKSAEFLAELGVIIMNNSRVQAYDGKVLSLLDGQHIPSSTVIWSAGVKGVVLDGLNPEIIVRGNRLKVNEVNLVDGYRNIYAIGDVAAMITEEFPNGHPGVAPAAIQQGKLLAKNLLNIIQKRPLEPFEYIDKGTMATVGRNRAVVDLHKIRFQGVFAWFTWMFVHLMTLVGFRNKLVVFVNWVWSYFSYDRGTRLIIRPFIRPKDLEEISTPHDSTTNH